MTREYEITNQPDGPVLKVMPEREAGTRRPLVTLNDFLEAAQRLVDQEPPATEIELTDAEFEQLKRVMTPHLRVDHGRSADAPPMWMGLRIVVTP